MTLQGPTIVFSGGGTLGPVVPLLAVWDELQKQDDHMRGLWIGTPGGPEQSVVEASGMEFISFASPKLRRHFSVKTFALPFTFPASIYRAMLLLLKRKPQMVVTAGGFTSVPIHIAAWLMRIPGFVHQQDAQIGLANKIMAPLAASVTVAFPDTAKQFSKKTVCIGNPVRLDVMSGSKERAIDIFDLEKDVPVVLVLGGGTGAQALNDEIWNALPELTERAQIIHSTGEGKGKKMQANRYRQFPFIAREDLAHAYAAADIVVARAGMGTLSEITALTKAAVLVPIPHSHQEYNAQQFVRAGAAVDGSVGVVRQIVRLLESPAQRESLTKNLHNVLRTDAGNRLAQMIRYGLNKNKTTQQVGLS